MAFSEGSISYPEMRSFAGFTSLTSHVWLVGRAETLTFLCTLRPIPLPGVHRGFTSKGDIAPKPFSLPRTLIDLPGTFTVQQVELRFLYLGLKFAKTGLEGVRIIFYLNLLGYLSD